MLKPHSRSSSLLAMGGKIETKSLRQIIKPNLAELPGGLTSEEDIRVAWWPPVDMSAHQSRWIFDLQGLPVFLVRHSSHNSPINDPL